jgi:hypothetical protein
MDDRIEEASIGLRPYLGIERVELYIILIIDVFSKIISCKTINKIRKKKFTL